MLDARTAAFLKELLRLCQDHQVWHMAGNEDDVTIYQHSTVSPVFFSIETINRELDVYYREEGV